MDKTLVEGAGYLLADDYRDRILGRTGLTRMELVCPRETSEMTPCVARDGRLAVYFSVRPATSTEIPACCVGCEMSVSTLMKQELERPS